MAKITIEVDASFAPHVLRSYAKALKSSCDLDGAKKANDQAAKADADLSAAYAASVVKRIAASLKDEGVTEATVAAAMDLRSKGDRSVALKYRSALPAAEQLIHVKLDASGR